jgi:Glycosyltransferase 61
MVHLDSALTNKHTAYKQLMKGCPDDALQTLQTISGSEDRLTFFIRLAALALQHERYGRYTHAESCINEILQLGCPFPNIILVCGRYFKRRGDFRKSFECFSLLQHLISGVINEFINGLPPVELSRYAPLIIPIMLLGSRAILYGLQPTKEALRMSLGDEGAAVAYAEIIRPTAESKVICLPLIGLEEYARRFGLAFERLNSPGAVHVPAIDIFSKSPGTGFHARARSFFFTIISNATITSKSSFILTDLHAILDVQEGELSNAPVNLDVDPSVVAVQGDSIITVTGGPWPRIYDLDEAFSLVGVHSGAFGHWIFEFLPKLLACLARPGFDKVPILIDQQMPPQHQEALKLFVGQAQPIIVLKPCESLHVKRLWTCSALIYFPLGLKPGWTVDSAILSFDTNAFADLIRAAQPKLDFFHSRTRSGRVYLTRGDALHRKLTNKSEVEAFLTAHGFAVYDFNDLTFADQLSIIRSAEMIVGADGSVMLTAIFARAGTRIGVLSGPSPAGAEWYGQLFRELWLPNSFLTGPIVHEDSSYQFFSDYSIDIGQLAPFIVHLQEQA